ncbi:MAG: four helix bundle protein [Bacteroidales bacterium]|nr:four helix bundle protein [Bacteroidales bacterium]
MYKTNSTTSGNVANKYEIKIEDLTFNFAKQVVFLHKYLTSSTIDKEYIISKQIVRSGTSIAANVAEAMFPQSDADYLSKMNIALKEANETKLWLRLLKECNYISEEKYQTLLHDCEKIIKILFTIVNKLKKRIK